MSEERLLSILEARVTFTVTAAAAIGNVDDGDERDVKGEC